MTVGWDDPRTAALYEAFCATHPRYRVASAALVAQAAVLPHHRVLDVAAGIGGTAEAVLARLGSNGRVVCVEPAAAIRERGAARITDPRITWAGDLPDSRFDRVIIGAAIWQMTPLAESLARFAARLAPGGALVFDCPAAYLGEPDGPGGGADPYLAALGGLLAVGRTLAAAEPQTLPNADGLTAMLRAVGLRVERWEHRRRMTQTEYRDWLKIPPISDRLLADLEPDRRVEQINAAFARVDVASWRWERWLGFRAWSLGSGR